MGTEHYLFHALGVTYTAIQYFIRGNQSIREVIPVPDSLKKNNKFTVFSSSRGYLKCHMSRLVLGINNHLALSFGPLYIAM